VELLPNYDSWKLQYPPHWDNEPDQPCPSCGQATDDETKPCDECQALGDDDE
jgi:hypothetical protein